MENLILKIMDNQNDDHQQTVVSQKWDSKIVVSAGPGTGKSYTAALRVASIIKQISSMPDYPDPLIVCLTYTNAATYVTNERLIQQKIFAGVEVRTIDAWCTKLSSQFGLNEEVVNFNFDRRISKLVEFIRDSSDFEFPVEINHIVVDEAQDIYGPRRELFELLIAKKLIRGWTVLGDPAQTIYEFESDGKDISFLDFVIKSEIFDLNLELLVDHRSKSEKARSVRALGSELRKENPSQSGIEGIWREYLDTHVINCSQMVENAMNYNASGETVGILLRNNRQLLQLSTMLSKKSVNHHFYAEDSDAILPPWIADLDQVQEIEDLLCMAPSYIDSNSLERLFNRWCQGGRSKRISMERVAEDLRRSRIPQVLKMRDPEIVSLSTIHRSKGLEYEKVIVGMEREFRENNILEKQEARLLFVALTRSQFSIVRLNMDELKTTSKFNKTIGRWMDFKFKGKEKKPVGLEVRMKDFVFIRQPDTLSIGDQVLIKKIKGLEENIGLFEAYEPGNNEPFAYLSQDFSSAVHNLFAGVDPSVFNGLYVQSLAAILVPTTGRDNWKQKYFAKVPFIAGMVYLAPKG